jgi:hypothetical protein
MLAAFVLAAALGFFLYLVYRTPPVAYALLAAIVGANGLFIDVGIAVSASRLLTLAFLPWAVLRTGGVFGSGSLRGITTPSVALMGYVLVITAASQTFFLPPMAGDLGEVRESVRWLIQWLSFCVSMMPLLIAPLALRSTDDCMLALRAFIYGVAAMCALALVQWCAAQFFETPILGIARYGLLDPDYDTSYFYLGDVIVQRANGLAREPKDLAAATAIALVSLALIGLPGLRQSRSRFLALGALLFGGLVVSFATTGAMLVALGAVFVALSVATTPDTQAASPRHASRRVYYVGAIAICGVAALYFLQSDYFSAILQERVTSRIGMVEDYDQVTLAFLLDNPSWWATGVGAGLLPFYANDYLPNDPALLEYMMNYTWDAKAGLLRWLGSFGLIGCALAALILYRVFSRLARMLSQAPGPEDFQFRRGALLMFSYLAAVEAIRGIDELCWVLIGVFLAYATARARAPLRDEVLLPWAGGVPAR